MSFHASGDSYGAEHYNDVKRHLVKLPYQAQLPVNLQNKRQLFFYGTVLNLMKENYNNLHPAHQLELLLS